MTPGEVNVYLLHKLCREYRQLLPCPKTTPVHTVCTLTVRCWSTSHSDTLSRLSSYHQKGTGTRKGMVYTQTDPQPKFCQQRRKHIPNCWSGLMWPNKSQLDTNHHRHPPAWKPLKPSRMCQQDRDWCTQIQSSVPLRFPTFQLDICWDMQWILHPRQKCPRSQRDRVDYKRLLMSAQ